MNDSASTEARVAAEPTAGASRPDPPPILFVGGTGRSGTHVVAKLLGRHSHFRNVPNEARFHVNSGGFPDLLAGRAGAEEFIRHLRGKWWRELEPVRRRRRGLHRHVPRSRLEAAVAAFRERYATDPEAACRELFWDLLGPLAASEGKPGLIEQSCDTIAEAPTLLRLFGEARFVHVVRDGRDTAASRVDQGRWLVHPRTMRQGLEWWEGRMRRIDAGVRAVPDDRVHLVSLDELVELRRRRTYRRLRRFAGLDNENAMAGFFRRQVSGGDANTGRWRRGMSGRRQREIDAAYGEVLDRLERDRVHGVRFLQRVHAQRP